MRTERRHGPRMTVNGTAYVNLDPDNGGTILISPREVFPLSPGHPLNAPRQFVCGFPIPTGESKLMDTRSGRVRNIPHVSRDLFKSRANSSGGTTRAREEG